MFDNDDDDLTMFDPDPWGARHRVTLDDVFGVAAQRGERLGGPASPRAVAATPTAAASLGPSVSPPARACVPAPVPAHGLAPTSAPSAAAPAFAPTFAPAALSPALAAPAGFAPLRIPSLPRLPTSVRAFASRYAVPLCGVAAMLLLAMVYARMPTPAASAAPSAASSVVITPIADEPRVEPVSTPALATSSTPEPEVELAPAVVVEPPPQPPAAKKKKPRVQKRRPIKLDASITSTPLGHLRPSKTW